jgi:hypothetical protein
VHWGSRVVPKGYCRGPLRPLQGVPAEVSLEQDAARLHTIGALEECSLAAVGGTRGVLEGYSRGTRGVLEGYSRGTRGVLEGYFGRSRSSTAR